MMERPMKDSGVQWIGEIPYLWSLCRMKSCISSRESGAWGEEETGEDGDVICLRIADFDYDRFRFKTTNESDLTLRHYQPDVIQRLQLQKNDILIEKSGGGEKTPVGRTVVFDKNYTALFANFMDRLRCTEKVNPLFMQYVFVTFYKNEYTRNYIKQTTGIQNLDLTSMLACESIPLPDTTEQERIVNLLDRKCEEIDSVIAKTEKTIEEYKALKQSIITEAVTKGIRPNRPMKDSGNKWFGMIPINWEMKRIKYVFRIKKEIAGKEGYSVLSITQRGVLPKNIESNEGQLAENYSHYQFLHLGQFAMNHMDLLTGWVDISKYDGVTSPDYRVFELTDNINHFPEFYLFLMQMCYSNRIFYGLGQGVSGMGRWRLQSDKFLNFTIPIPDYEEQCEIAIHLKSVCSEMDKLIAAKQQLLIELEAYKKSVIYEYVTGKKEAIF